MIDLNSESGGEPARGRRVCSDVAGGALLLSLPLAAAAPSTLFAVAAAALVAAFLFSLFENALVHYSMARLMADAKRRGVEEAIQKALDDEEETAFASKVGRGICQTVGIACFAVGLVESRPSELAAIGVAVAVALGFLVFNVAAPYLLGSRAGHSLLLRALIPYRHAIFFLRPLSALLHRSAARLVRAGEEPPDRSAEITDEILSAVEEGGREGVLGDSERRMITGVIDLREVTADQIMTPRTEMVCIRADASVREALAAAAERGLSRLPVYRSTPDEILGVLYVKDLIPYVLGKEPPPPIERVMRRAFLIPQSKSVRELLHEMKARQVHLAVVVDEYGGTAGVVTIEDILEEIVGEIADEHEVKEPEDVVKLHDDAATVDGRTHIDELNSALDIELPEGEEYDTVGGLLLNRMGYVPSPGEQIDLLGVRFTVLEADARRVNRVKVTVQRS
ncbi:MAG: hemolysin family protein [Planctomycetota bacterium]